MKFTTLQVTKTSRNEFYVEIHEVTTDLCGLTYGKTRKWSAYVHSIGGTQAILSKCPNRDCQRIGTSTRVAHRFRLTKVGGLCFTVRWDGGAGRIPDNLLEWADLSPIQVAWELIPFSFDLNAILEHARKSVDEQGHSNQGEV